MRLLEVHLEVADIERSLALYTKLLPHKSVTRWDDGLAVALVFDDGSAFGLWAKGKTGIHNGRGGAHVHFAFRIEPEEYGHYVELIRAAGLEPLEHDWPGGGKSVYFFDYDGNQGEFMTIDW